MNTHRALILALALAAGLLAPAIRAQAAEEAIVIARAESGDPRFGRDGRRAGRSAEGERGYGYGYERRQGAERPGDFAARDRAVPREWRPERQERRDRNPREEGRPSRNERH